MDKKYEKWRDLSIDPFDIEFKNILLKEIISYPPAGNDVIECKCLINDTIKEVFIKIERSKMADFETEVTHLQILHDKKFYKKIPIIYESGTVLNKLYIVLEKLNGERLSDIFNDRGTELKEEHLLKYGRELAIIHSIYCDSFKISKKRIINDYPKEENYSYDEFILSYIDYLKENKPVLNDDTFIHGDFHYANILWKNNEINGVIDFEYSGKGFKEQDIAWACVLRPTQYFMDNIDDIKDFLRGYCEIGSFDFQKLKWCFLNAYSHFYLMNINNQQYKNKLQKLIEQMQNFNFN